MSDGVRPLRVAEPGAKQEIAKMLDRLHVELESGDLVHLLVVAIHRDEHYSTRASGDLRASQLAGYLGRAHLDALEKMG